MKGSRKREKEGKERQRENREGKRKGEVDPQGQ
jgi:hypothetical protein